MNPFEGLTRLFTSRVDGFAPMDDKFVRPDREATARSMRLAERGREQGELELPASGSTTLDVVEREIVSTVAQHLDTAHIDTCNHLRAYEDRLSDLHLLHGLGAIRGETKKTLGDIKARVGEWHDRLSIRRDGVIASYREVRDFQKANNLTRTYHSLESRWVHGATIGIAWFAETAGNTIFLSENNPMGVIGGVVAAAFVAAINVALAVTAGVHLFRRTYLPGKAAAGVAWAGIILWLGITILWNLAAGHFRDAQSAGLEDPQMAALAMVWNDPLGFASFYSWGMLIIGLLAAFVSAHEGFKMNDPYPGYGALGQQHDRRCAEYADLVAEARRKLAEERDRAIAAAQSVKDELGVQFRERGRIHSAHAHLMKRFQAHHDLLQDLTNFLLQEYRNANLRARSTPPPKHFGEQFELARLPVPELHEEPVDRAGIEKAEAALNEGIDSVTAAFDSAIESFTPLGDLKKDLVDGSL